MGFDKFTLLIEPVDDYPDIILEPIDVNDVKHRYQHLLPSKVESLIEKALSRMPQNPDFNQDDTDGAVQNATLSTMPTLNSN